MAVNQVIYGGETLIDLTGDTVTPETLISGTTAHDASGNQITGTLSPAEGYRFVKVASDFNCVRAVTTIDIKSYDWYKSVTVNDIYCVTKGVKATTAGTFPRNATCSPIVSYSNGVISLNRGAIDGSLVITFIMDVYIALPL